MLEVKLCVICYTYKWRLCLHASLKVCVVSCRLTSMVWLAPFTYCCLRCFLQTDLYGLISSVHVLLFGVVSCRPTCMVWLAQFTYCCLCCFLQTDLYGLIGTVHVLLFALFLADRPVWFDWHGSHTAVCVVSCRPTCMVWLAPFTYCCLRCFL